MTSAAAVSRLRRRFDPSISPIQYVDEPWLTKDTSTFEYVQSSGFQASGYEHLDDASQPQDTELVVAERRVVFHREVEAAEALRDSTQASTALPQPSERRVSLGKGAKLGGIVAGLLAIQSLLLWLLSYPGAAVFTPYAASLILVAAPFIFAMGAAIQRNDRASA